MMNLWLLLPAVAALSLLLTAGLRRYAIARSLIDVPNARSSHQVPTPRGAVSLSCSPSCWQCCLRRYWAR